MAKKKRQDIEVDVEEFLTLLEMRNVDASHEDEVCFSCPFPGHLHGDEKPSAYMNKKTTAWICHGCKRKGNAVTFLSQYENISPMKAKRYIREAWGTGYREFKGSVGTWMRERLKEPEREPPKNQPIGEEFLELTHHNWDSKDDPHAEYMRSRGFDPGTLDKWDVGVDPVSSRVTIPVRQRNGDLIGFKARSIDPEQNPKYLVLGDRKGWKPRYGFPTYEVSESLLGSHMVADAVPELVLVEGELDAIALHMYGIKAVAFGGGNMSEWQVHKVQEMADSVVIFMDWDDAGIKATDSMAEKLHPHMRVRVVGEHEGDPASMPESTAKTLIHNAVSWTRLMIGSPLR